MKIYIRNALLILLLFLLIPISAIDAAPPIGQSFYGSVTLEGVPAPEGTSVTAEMNGRGVASTSVDSQHDYAFIISTIEGDQGGDTISFFVGGLDAGSASFTPGGITQNDLSASTPPPPPPPPNQKSLTVLVNGNGTTTPSPGISSYNEGLQVTISAIPAEGWVFVNWTGATVANPNSATTTIILDSDKTITANFEQEVDITPPVIINVIATSVTKTGADISWTTNEPATSQLDYAASPGVLTPLDDTLVTEHLVSLSGLTPSTIYTYKILSQDASGNLTESAEFTFTTEGLPATFVLSNWGISITEVGDGRQASITFLLDNVGDLHGSYEVVMTVNGVEEDSQVIELDAGGSQTVSFSTTKTAPGPYSTDVNSVSFSFTVPSLSESVEVGLNIKWPVVGGIAGGVILILATILLLLKRRYYILVRK